MVSQCVSSNAVQLYFGKRMTRSKPRLLFLCSRSPYPPIGGDRLKNFHLIRELARSFDLTMVCLVTEEMTTEGLSYLKQYGEVHIHYKSRFDFFRAAIRAPFSIPIPLQASLYYFKDIAEHIRKLAASHDAVFCNLIRTAIYAEDISLPRFCDLSDSISGHYSALLKRHLSPMYPYYLLDAPLIARYERHVIQTFDQCFLFNREEMNPYKMPDKLTWIPLGVNPELLKIETADPDYNDSVVFFGKMDYRPNVAAVSWFAKKVVPLMDKRLKFVIIGASPCRDVRALANERVRVTGFMADAYPALRGSLAVVAPMQFGGGIQNKILEAMSVGGLCIATSSPARTLQGAQHGKEILIADKPEEYVEILHDIHLNPEAYAHIRSAAQVYILENHSWKSAGDIYTNSIMDTLGA